MISRVQVMSSFCAWVRQRPWLLMSSSGYFLARSLEIRSSWNSLLLDPLGQRAPLLVVGEVVGQPLRVELELAARRAQRMLLGILVELPQTGRDLLPIRIGGDDVVLLVLEVLPADRPARAPCCRSPTFIFSSDGHAAGVLLVEPQLLGHLAHGLVVAERLADGLDGLVLDDAPRAPTGRRRTCCRCLPLPAWC